jgi:histidinol-phosphate/aromatic aminotransferase/cobyric acid decarboxylase-like protein
MVLDFSVSLNAFGPSPVVRAAIAECAVDEYPDPTARAARMAAAASWGCDPEWLLMGAGSAELLHAICRAYLAPGRSAVVLRPCFGEYERAAVLAGATVHAVSDLPAMMELLEHADVHVAFVATPDSPLGRSMPRAALAALADACFVHDVLLVVDQAYDAFASAPLGTPALADAAHVVHLRSLTKEHALAGVRVAFAHGHAEVLRQVDAARVPWSSSRLAQAAAVAVFEPAAREHARESVRQLRAESAQLELAMRERGIAVSPSDTHYRLLACRDAGRARAALLESEHLLVRDCSSFGLPRHIRVAARVPHENARLLRAIDAQAWHFQPSHD